MSIVSSPKVACTSVDVVDLIANWDALQPAWDEFVDAHPKGSIFHTSDMVQVFAATKGHKPLAIAAVGEHNEILALLVAVRVQTLPRPFGRISSRSILYAEPLCYDDQRSIDALVRLIAQHDAYMRRSTLFSEIRPLFAPGAERIALASCGYDFLEYLNYIVDVGAPPDAIWRGMRRNTRRAINKAEAAGYEIREIVTPVGVDQLYEYIKLSYAKAGVPLADKSLFDAAFKYLIAKNRFRILAVAHNDEIVTMHAMLKYKDLAYAWYIGTQRKLGYSPGDLLKWREFLWCHDHGCTRYDMGGAGWPDEAYGVRDYKAKFGGQLVCYGRYRKVFAPWKLAAAERVYGLRRNLLRRKTAASSDVDAPADKQPATRIGSPTTKSAKRPARQTVDLFDEWDRLQPAWDEFVEQHPKCSVFHTSAMMRVFKSAKGHTPFARAAVAANGEILSLLVAQRVQTLPKLFGAVSSRSVWYAEPLCHDTPDSVDSLSELIAEHDRMSSRRALFAEVRPLHAAGPERQALERCGYQHLDYLNYVLDTTQTRETLWKGVHRSAQAHVRRCEQRGFEYREIEGPESVDVLYGLLRQTYGRSGVPLADRSLFDAAYRILKPLDRLTIVGVHDGDKVLAVDAMLLFNGQVFAWYGGSLRIKGVSPAAFLQWREIEWSSAQGYKRYDFGGAGWPNVPYGVRDFKAAFGGELVCYGRYRNVYSRWKMAVAERAYELGRAIISPK
jgi:CelD/BcsL family acetyltransferase involved in cellulose biosynthesis